MSNVRSRCYYCVFVATGCEQVRRCPVNLQLKHFYLPQRLLAVNIFSSIQQPHLCSTCTSEAGDINLQSENGILFKKPLVNNSAIVDALDYEGTTAELCRHAETERDNGRQRKSE